MMKNFLKSPRPIVIPMEVLQSANGFIARKANRFAIPYVSIEKRPTPETGITVGNTNQPIVVPIIVVGPAQNRVGEQIAQFLAAEMAKREGVETTLMNVRDLATAQPALSQADAMILVAPEYNYGYPDALKSLLEKNLADNKRRAIGICDLSPGWFGGARLLETLLPVMRKSGVMPIFWDENCSNGENFFQASHSNNNHFQCERIDNFLNELLNLAAMFRQRRNNLLPN